MYVSFVFKGEHDIVRGQKNLLDDGALIPRMLPSKSPVVTSKADVLPNKHASPPKGRDELENESIGSF